MFEDEMTEEHAFVGSDEEYVRLNEREKTASELDGIRALTRAMQGIAAAFALDKAQKMSEAADE